MHVPCLQLFCKPLHLALPTASTPITVDWHKLTASTPITVDWHKLTASTLAPMDWH